MDCNSQNVLLDAVNIWGTDLCAWCCAVSPAELDELRRFGAQVPQGVATLAEALVELGQDAQKRTREDHPLRAMTLLTGWLARHVEDQEHTLLNRLRVEAGGQLPAVADDDPLVQPLRMLARDVLPAYLLLGPGVGGPEIDRQLMELGRTSLFQESRHDHPALDEFTEQFERDDRMEPLRAVMSQESPVLRRLADVSATGSAYIESLALPQTPLLTPRSLARELVEAAWERERLDGGSDVGGALDRLPLVVDEFTRGLAGEEIDVPAYVGLRGLGFDQADAEIPIRGGRLRSPRWHEWLYGSEDDGVGLVLELTVRARLSVRADPGPGAWTTHWHSEPWSDLLARGEDVALASALASPSGAPPAVSVAWGTMIGPLGEVEPLLREAGRLTELVVLDEADRRELATWVARMRRAGSQLPGVARRRSFSALHARRFYADGLLDAIIALESLLGGGPSVRMQAAVAWLLAPDSYAERRRRYDQIEALYSLRSGVVHEGQQVVGSQWVDMVEVLREVIRRLLTERIDLLGQRDRSTRLILGATADD